MINGLGNNVSVGKVEPAFFTIDAGKYTFNDGLYMWDTHIPLDRNVLDSNPGTWQTMLSTSTPGKFRGIILPHGGSGSYVLEAKITIDGVLHQGEGRMNSNWITIFSTVAVSADSPGSVTTLARLVPTFEPVEYTTLKIEGYRGPGGSSMTTAGRVLL